MNRSPCHAAGCAARAVGYGRLCSTRKAGKSNDRSMAERFGCGPERAPPCLDLSRRLGVPDAGHSGVFHAERNDPLTLSNRGAKIGGTARR